MSFAGKRRSAPNPQAASHDAGFAGAIAASKTGSLAALERCSSTGPAFTPCRMALIHSVRARWNYFSARNPSGGGL